MRDQNLSCVTWNIHRAVGRDRSADPDRVLKAIGRDIAPLHPDILALQEADTDAPPHSNILDLDAVSRVTGLSYAHRTPHLRWGAESGGFLGTIMFVRSEAEVRQADVIDLPGHCHRGAIALELHMPAGDVRVISTHLSLGQPLRIAQMRTIGQYIRRRPEMRTILLGDLNEWRFWGGLALSKSVIGRRLYGPVLRSFPSSAPLLPLDRILTDAPHAITKARVLSGRATTDASDHRPVFAQVALSKT